VHVDGPTDAVLAAAMEFGKRGPGDGPHRP
jgi:hypothetical protein